MSTKKPGAKKNTGLIFFIMTLVVGIAAAGVTMLTINNMAQETTVYVAASDLPAFTRIERGHLATQRVHARDVHPRAVSDPDKLVGRYLSIPVKAGLPILTNMLIETDGAGSTLAYKIGDDPSYRAIAVPVSQVTGLAGGTLIKPGDKVDVFATVMLPAEHGQEPQTKCILAGVPILDFVKDQDNNLSAAVLKVTPDDAEMLVFALGRGSIHFALNPYDADPSRALKTTGIDFETYQSRVDALKK